MSSGCTSAISIAARPDLIARSEVGEPMRRSRDSRAFSDPLITGVHHGGEFVIGDPLCQAAQFRCR